MLCMERTKLKWQWHLPQSSKKRIIYSLIFAFSPSPFSSCSLVFCFCIQVSLCRISTFNLVLLLKLFCTFDCSFFNYVVCVCVPVCCNSIEMTSFVFSLEKMYHIQMIACKLLLAISFYRSKCVLSFPSLFATAICVPSNYFFRTVIFVRSFYFDR